MKKFEKYLKSAMREKAPRQLGQNRSDGKGKYTAKRSEKAEFQIHLFACLAHDMRRYRHRGNSRCAESGQDIQSCAHHSFVGKYFLI